MRYSKSLKGYWFFFFFISFHAVQGQEIRQPTDSVGKPIRFVPRSFSNSFSLNITPVLVVHPGDTVFTETIDAMGYDKAGVKRQRGGNPLTGPFYIENCFAGDVIKITLTHIALNRPYAYTTEGFVSRSVPDEISKAFKKPRLVKWKLDMENGTGWPDSAGGAYEHLKNFTVPLKPFLGCIGVAPDLRKNEILSFFQGAYGGNMDFSRIGQSAIVYLPVFHDGAYFYIGDGHAAQGDGEIAGNALETSLNVAFTIQVIKKERLTISSPRVEDSLYIMCVGTAKNLDDALKKATGDLAGWLQTDYRLSLAECTQVMSTCIEYSIAEIADPEVIVVAKIKKALLKSLRNEPDLKF